MGLYNPFLFIRHKMSFGHRSAFNRFNMAFKSMEARAMLCRIRISKFSVPRDRKKVLNVFKLGGYLK